MGPIGLPCDFSVCAVQTDILQLNIIIKFCLIDIFASHTCEDNLIIFDTRNITLCLHRWSQRFFRIHTVHQWVAISPVPFQIDTLKYKKLFSFPEEFFLNSISLGRSKPATNS